MKMNPYQIVSQAIQMMAETKPGTAGDYKETLQNIIDHRNKVVELYGDKMVALIDRAKAEAYKKGYIDGGIDMQKGSE